MIPPLIFLTLFLVTSTIGSSPLAAKPSEIGCVRTSTGTDYTGSQNVSSSGRPCVRWDSLVGAFRDHIKMLFLTMPERHATKAQNFCRNPNSDQRGLWCFVSQLGTVQFCSVPKCAVFGSTSTAAGPVTQRTRRVRPTTTASSDEDEDGSWNGGNSEYNEVRGNSLSAVDRYDVAARDMQNDEASDDTFANVNQLYNDDIDPYEASSLMEQKDDESDEWPADRPSPIQPSSFRDSASQFVPSTISLTLASLAFVFAL